MFSGFERNQVGGDTETDQVPVAMGVFYFEERDPNFLRIWKHTRSDHNGLVPTRANGVVEG